MWKLQAAVKIKQSENLHHKNLFHFGIVPNISIKVFKNLSLQKLYFQNLKKANMLF
jgi:hypothetical protein